MDKKTNWDKTLDFIYQAFNDNYQADIFKLLMTTDERNALITRVKIIEALLSGEINQRQLKDQLGVGIATVTRGSNSLKDISPEFKNWLIKNLQNNKKN